MSAPSPPLLSVISPCLNERRAIGDYLDRLEAAAREAQLEGRFEVVLADGMSTDGTREWLAEARASRPWLRVVDNPEKRTPAGRNAALRASRGAVLAVVDVHWHIDRCYFRKLLPALEDPGVGAVGGVFEAVPTEHPVARVITRAFESPLATGPGMRLAPGVQDAWRETSIVPGGLFRRELFERLGLFDERLWRNQDEEFMVRLRRAGLRVLQNRSVHIGYLPRRSYRALFRQYYEYGIFKRYALPTPGWSRLQLLPLAAVAYLVGAALLLPAAPLPAAAALGAYPLGLALAEAGWRLRARRPAPPAVLWPIMLMQLGYGLGLWRGLFVGRGHPLTRPPVIPALQPAAAAA
jgi:succinoglycan biosynthesis protein ExoA